MGRSYRRGRRRFVRRQDLVWLGAMLGVMLVVVIIVVSVRGGRNSDEVLAPQVSQTPSEESLVVLTPAPTPQPTPTPTPIPAMFPVLSQINLSDTGTKIAITVDDCFRTDNVRIIMDMCDELGVKVTFFPVARGVKNDMNLWGEVYQRGFQIENHTYTHTNLLNVDEETIYNEIHEMEKLINRALGFQYKMRFLRTQGGSARNDERVHKAMGQLGYEFMTHWSISGSDSSSTRTLEKLKPGQILLFHATDSDVEKLQFLMPIMVERGYQLVTLNELLQLQPNETALLEES